MSTAWLTLRARYVAPERQLVIAGACSVALLVLAIGAIDAPGLRISALCGAVFFLGPCYSLILGRGLERVPTSSAARATGPLVAGGAAGGAALPALALLAGWEPGDQPALMAAAGLIVGIILLRPG